jgi:Siphovirus ReqiPepy6 Gp37-like protein
MELYTLNRSYFRQDIIEEFESLIWTERFYGDSECEVVVPLVDDPQKSRQLLQSLQAGTLLAIDQSREPMIIETFSIEEGKIKVMGISILSWLNNRFVRNSVKHKKTNWKISNQKAGQILWTIVKQMCTDKSTIIGTGDMGLGLGATGIARENELIIPKLRLDDWDDSGKKIKKTLVPYGPVYDALRKIAEQHAVGMQIWLNDDNQTLRFRSYKGADRTTGNKIIRFSPVMDSFTNVKELRSRATFKTLVYSYASSLEKIDTADHNTDPDTWLQQDGKPGIYRRPAPQTGKYTGFDLRAEMILVEDITIKTDFDEGDDADDTVSGKRQELLDILNNRAEKEAKQNPMIKTVDAEVAPTNLFQYGRDYNLGDKIQIQGVTGITEDARVTEYIRTQDSSGEKSYPTVDAVDP